jgi:SacI homology domain
MRAPNKIAEVGPGLPQTANTASMQQSPTTSVKDAGSSPLGGDSSTEQAPESRFVGQDRNENSIGEKDTTVPLLPKLLRSTRLILSSRSFYFSYDFNITRRMGDPRILNAKPLGYEDIDPLVCTFVFPVSGYSVTKFYSISGIET